MKVNEMRAIERALEVATNKIESIIQDTISNEQCKKLVAIVPVKVAMARTRKLYNYFLKQEAYEYARDLIKKEVNSE